MKLTDRTKKIIENIAKKNYADRIEGEVYKIYDVPEAKERKVARLAKKLAFTSDISGMWEQAEEFIEEHHGYKFDRRDVACILLGDRLQDNGMTGWGDPVYFFEEDPNSEAASGDAYSIAVELGIIEE